jgi:hypothetical protein
VFDLAELCGSMRLKIDRHDKHDSPDERRLHVVQLLQCGRTETTRRGLAIVPWYLCREYQSWWVSRAEQASAVPNPAIGPQVLFQAMMSAELPIECGTPSLSLD